MPDLGMPPNEAGNPDAAQDTDLIRSVMDTELRPVFELIGSRLQDLEEDLEDVKDMLYKFYEPVVGVHHDHRKSVLSDELKSKYGSDIEPFDGMLKDFTGKSLSDSLIEELMGENAPDEAGRDEFVKGKLGEAKTKYGKYLGTGNMAAPKAEMSVTKIEAEPKKEAEAEEALPGAEEMESKPVSETEKLMKTMQSLGGAKGNIRGKSKKKD